MQKVKPIYHLLFWVFVFFYTFEVIVDYYELVTAITFSTIEVMCYGTIFYTNLLFLIPKLLKAKSKVHYFIGLLLFLAFIIAITFIFDMGHYYEDSNIRLTITFVLNYLLYILISFLYWYFILYLREKNDNLALQNDKLQAELLLLKSQVSPHFLFNSLNNIYSLSITKHDNAPVMIEKLSDILRYIIYEGTKNEVHLEREVELMNNYIDLQLLKKLKAEKNIKVTTKGVKSAHKIAPLILINLVENCFKHSDIAYHENGFLEIDLRVSNEQLSFHTINSYKASSKKSGIGLKNIQQQLQHYYPEAHRLKIESDEAVFRVEMQIDLPQ